MTSNFVCKSCCPVGSKYLFRLVTERREGTCSKCQKPTTVVDLKEDDLYPDEIDDEEDYTIYRR